MPTKTAGAVEKGDIILSVEGLDYGGAEVISVRERRDGDRHDVLIDVTFPDSRTPWSIPALDAMTQVEVQ